MMTYMRCKGVQRIRITCYNLDDCSYDRCRLDVLIHQGQFCGRALKIISSLIHLSFSENKEELVWRYLLGTCTLSIVIRCTVNILTISRVYLWIN